MSNTKAKTKTSKKKTTASSVDVVPKGTNDTWVYTDIVKDHFFHPKNLVTDASKMKNYDGLGMVGSPACGDMMKIWIKVDKKNDKIKEMKWQTFGCGSAIAATSMLTDRVKGMSITDINKLTDSDIYEMLGVTVSPGREKCALLAIQAKTAV